MSTSHTVFELFLFVIVFQLTYGSSHEDEKISESGSLDFDLLIFTQRWLAGVCVQQKEMLSLSSNCFLPTNEEWSIHGIWPAQFHKLGPSFCNKTLHLNESALYPIVPELEKKMRNLAIGTPHFPFWKHEWEKHGTCAIDLPEFVTELKYFQNVLNLGNEYGMTHILAKAGILPGRNYAVEEIIDGVQKVIKHNVQINCFKNAKTQQSYLVAIKICLDKSLKLADCNGIYNFPTNCDRNLPVNYLSITPFRNNGMNSIWQIGNQILLLLCTYISNIAVF